MGAWATTVLICKKTNRLTSMWTLDFPEKKIRTTANIRSNFIMKASVRMANDKLSHVFIRLSNVKCDMFVVVQSRLISS